jgi:hypothetical protein
VCGSHSERMDALTVLTLTIRLYDATGLSHDTWEQAIAVAASTLHQTGVKAQWMDCSAPAAAGRCQAPLVQNELILRVRHASKRTGTQTLGDAVVDTRVRAGSFATLYANRIIATAADSGVDQGVVLGRALAHEIGHLLLGRRDHAAGGLMRAHWTAVELQRSLARDWRFSDAELAEIRSALARRTGPALAAMRPADK